MQNSDTPDGLKVELRLWALVNHAKASPESWDAEAARLWLKGEVRALNVEINGAAEWTKFNDPGQLLTRLGQWNAELLNSKLGRRRAGGKS